MAGGAKRVRSVERALGVLCALAASPGPLGVTDLARRTGLPKSTVHLSLQTLRHLGFAEQEVGTDRYTLGLQAAQLGVAALDHDRLVGYLGSRMHDLAQRSREAVSLGVRAERSVVFIVRYETAHVLSTAIRVGVPMPLHASATGKVLLAALSDDEVRAIYPDEALPEQSEKTIRTRTALLAELAEVRRTGYAHNHDELYDGVSAAAVPVRVGDRVPAAVSIAGPTARFRAGDWIAELLELTASPDPAVVAAGGEDGRARADGAVEVTA
jgi:DNA-binding IclR family transcriptional regulator